MPVKSEPELEDGRPLWKDALLRRLQKSVHFVKTMSPSNVGGKTTMVIPAWFVNKHSHLFGKTICLQSEVLSVTKPWVVRLSVCKRATKQSPEVLFCRAGWRDFAVGHGLAEGDDLLFSLRAVSKFDVYVFRKPAPPRKRPRGFDEEVALSKPGDCSPGHSDEGVSRTKKPDLGENTGPIFAFRGRTKVQRCAATYHLHYLDSRDLQEPPCLRADVSQDRLESPIHERENDGNPKAVTEKAELKKTSPLRSDVLQHRQESPIRERENDGNAEAAKEKAGTKRTSPPSFRKRLTARNVGRGGSSLEVPCSFWRSAEAEGLHPPIVKLQGIHERSLERIVVCKWVTTGGSREQFRTYLTDGWREFGAENGLEVGQELVFTLAADSFFVVRAA